MGFGIKIGNPVKAFDRAVGTNLSGQNGGAKKFLGIGGAVGQTFQNINREAGTPTGRAILSGGQSLWIDPLVKGLKDKGEQYAPTDFSGVTSRWNDITDGFNTTGVANTIAQGATQGQLGVNNSMANLAQMGGAGVGSQGRIERASRWAQNMGEGQAVSDGNLASMQSKQSGIMSLDLPIAIGQDQAGAAAAAARARNGASTWGTIGTLAGAGLGFAVGGPAGASAGASFGGGLGSNYGSRNG